MNTLPYKWSIVAIATIVLSSTVGATAATIVSSTFDLDRDGWLASGDVVSIVPTHIPAGGNPGGAIEVDDQTVGGIWYYDAPAKFLGDKSAAYNQHLSFDLWQTGSGPQFESSDVVLDGAGLTLTIDAGTNPLPLNTWVSYSVLLREDAGWVKVTNHLNLMGPPATQTEMLAVLDSLDRLRVRGEFITGSDLGRLDNVNMVVPEAGSLGLLVAGLLLSGARTFRRWPNQGFAINLSEGTEKQGTEKEQKRTGIMLVGAVAEPACVQ